MLQNVLFSYINTKRADLTFLPKLYFNYNLTNGYRIQ